MNYVKQQLRETEMLVHKLIALTITIHGDKNSLAPK